MITVPGAPYGFHPGADDNRIFTDEGEHYDPTWRARILTTAAQMGVTDICRGPALANAYKSGDQVIYPATDWRDSAQFAAVLEDVKTWGDNFGGTITLTICPDNSTKYWLGQDKGWDLKAIDDDFGALYVELLKTGFIRKLRSCWETVARSAAMCAVFEYMNQLVARAGLPVGSVDIEYHTPDGHMWPGTSDEDEKVVALAGFAAGCNAIGYQYPLDQTEAGSVYDTKDGVRRVTGVWVDLGDGKPGNPWGNTTPLLDCYGRPVKFNAAEKLAERFEKYGCSQADLTEFATVMLAAGAMESGDGVPA